MSPILVRPVREQLEHDRVIRLLQSRFRRRFDVGVNPGQEQNTPVGSGVLVTYPDLVLMSMDRGRRVQSIIEVETAESVNNLEALAQWARMARLRSPLHLYVPASSVEAARRLCTDNQIAVAEVVSYNTIGDQLRFTSVYRAPADTRTRERSRAAARRRPAARPKAASRSGRAKKTARKTSRAPKRK